MIKEKKLRHFGIESATVPTNTGGHGGPPYCGSLLFFQKRICVASYQLTVICLLSSVICLLKPETFIDYNTLSE